MPVPVPVFGVMVPVAVMVGRVIIVRMLTLGVMALGVMVVRVEGMRDV